MNFNKYYKEYAKYLADNNIQSVKVQVIVPMEFNVDIPNVNNNGNLMPGFKDDYMLTFLDCFKLLYTKYKDGSNKVANLVLSQSIVEELEKRSLVVGFES